jgi:hypothetical protein
MATDTQLLDRKFEETEPSPSGQLPGEDPFKLHVHLRDSLTKTATSQAEASSPGHGSRSAHCSSWLGLGVGVARYCGTEIC